MNVNYSDLSLKDIEYLLTLAEYLHFGRAAEAALVSQPALSKQIREIESTLGSKIFERTKRQVRLTSKGQEIILQARRVADEANRLISVATSSDGILEGDLKLGIIASSGPYLIPRILKPIKKKYPKLNLIIHEAYTDDLIEMLKKGNLDMVIAADTFEDTALDKFDLFFEPFLLAASKKDPIAEKKNVTENDIKPENMILLEEGNCLSDQTWALCPIKNKEQEFSYQATSLETLYHMVASEIGYSLVPALSKSKDSIVNSMIAYKQFNKKSIGRKMIIALRKNYYKKDIDLPPLRELIIKHAKHEN